MEEDLADRKKEKETIISQVLPAVTHDFFFHSTDPSFLSKDIGGGSVEVVKGLAFFSFKRPLTHLSLSTHLSHLSFHILGDGARAVQKEKEKKT